MNYDAIRGALEQIKVRKIPAMHIGMNGWKYLKELLGQFHSRRRFCLARRDGNCHAPMWLS